MRRLLVERSDGEIERRQCASALKTHPIAMIEMLGTIAEAQGYLFSRPVPESEVSGLLRRDFRVQAA